MRVDWYPPHQVLEMKQEDYPKATDLHARGEEVVSFKSIYELADFVRATEVDSKWQNYTNYLPSRDTIATDNGVIPFNQAKNVLDAADLAEYGWAEGRQRLTAFQAALEKEWRKHIDSNSYIYGLMGFEVDIPTFLQNQPEHMIDFHQGQTQAKSLDVVVDINVRCSACGRRQHDAAPTNPDWLMIRGAALTMLLQILTKANYQPQLRVRATSYFSDRYREGYWPTLKSGGSFHRTVDVLIHKPGDMFDVDKINFALSHESMTRRLEWRVHEARTVETQGFPSKRSDVRLYGRGSFQPVGNLELHSSHHLDHLSVLPVGDVYIPSIPQVEDMMNPYSDEESGRGPLADMQDELRKNKKGDPFQSPESAATWVFDVLQAQGVVFTD